MNAASFRVTMAWTGKRPGKKVVPVDVATRDEAVLCALQWVVWSHVRGRPVKLPRYMTFRVEERDGTGWVTVREGTYRDATTEYGEEDAAEAKLRTVQSVPFSRSQRGPATGKYQASGRNRGTSRLANLVRRVLDEG